MKRLLFVLMVIGVLVISGCAKQAEESTADKTLPEEKSSADVNIYEQKTDSGESAKPAEEEVKAPEKAVTPEMQKLLDKSTSVSSLRYTYNEFIKGTTGYSAVVLFKGTKMRQYIKPGTNTYSGVFKAGERFDTIYFDLSTGVKKAYCEKATNCETDYMNKEVDVSDRKFITETPFDILEEVKYETLVRDEMVEGKTAKIAEIKMSDENIKAVWIWDYKGIPLKYEIRSADNEKLKSVTFSGLTINDVKDAEFVHSS